MLSSYDDVVADGDGTPEDEIEEQLLPTIAARYVEAGFKLVPIPKRKKGPALKGWNHLDRCIATIEEALKLADCNLGLAHAYSGTCCLDVDHYMGADTWLSDRGINLTVLLMAPDAVQICSGRPNRAKLLYRLPQGIASLPTHKVGNALEFRCAAANGLTVQDVLPPSIHPETGRPYEWKGDWQNLPELPEPLLTLWTRLGAAVPKDSKPKPSNRQSALEGVPEGERDDQLYRYACSLQAKGNTQAEAEALVRQAAANCTPPFPEAEAVAKVVRVYEQHSRGDTVGDLAKLAPLEYDQVRDETAKALKVRVSTLDKEVAKRRASFVEQNNTSIVEGLEAWTEPVDGLHLTDQIARAVSDHVALPDGARTAIALFILGTYCMDAWRVWPKLLITSPEKRCGKSTLLEAVEALTHRSLLTASITASSLFRCIEAWAPTLLIDEADTFTKDNEELNGIINAGHTRRTATVIRTEKVGDVFEPRKFSVWCPQIIAGIRSQRDTLHDRAIHIQMRRKLPGESVKKLPHDLFERLRPVRQRALRWVTDNLERLKNCTPDVPHLGNDRAQDNWSPLFVIAEVVGGDWPERVRNAYQTLTNAGEDEEAAGPMLLHDIKEIFDRQGRDQLFSRDLVGELVGLEERPWAEWRRGKPITPTTLAKLLHPYGVISGTVRLGGQTAKGYRRAQFEDAWSRYLPDVSDPAVQCVTPSQPSQGAAISPITIRHTDDNVTEQKPMISSNGAGCDGVTETAEVLDVPSWD